ncbi:type I-C CRISPR-associated protein Cas8c/Csd1 [Pelistega europaea]|uniref:Type I-C CRISPR-associated protein Cas8c/Csd1 n=1 Tax=Pelistega europaea TaxID=106147 RepID=A0A7Y4L8V0_9BURK|nr:type I-C CRISPR-associated protein Cas8c/Csd1 [Pelistega europaea]NOL49114.1 type I-C CRISPR-associated protein Cas8c/Csd1 [Pelistega europaea]
MILQGLTEYYHRKSNNEETSIAPRGFEAKEIPFVIVLDKSGHFIHLEDTREQDGKRQVGRKFLIPQTKTRSGAKSYEVSNDLWDHYGYVLNTPKEVDGVAKKTAEQISQEEAKNLDMANKQHQSFIERVNEIAQAIPDDEGVRAVKQFLSMPSEIEKVKQSDAWKDCQKIKGCNLSFRLADEPQALVCQSVLVRQWVEHSFSQEGEDGEQAICLVTGQKTKIARLHQGISGVNAKASPFASVNLKAFESYGKEQGMVFPVGEQAMFEYTTALNTLLASENRFRIGDVTAVCWGEKATPLETQLAFLVSSTKDNPDEHIKAVKTVFESLHNGQYVKSDGTSKFYLLGLSPNVARIVVRFWMVSTVAEITKNLAQWFEDIRMDRGENSLYPEYMPMMRLLCNLVLDGKAENLPSNLIADVIQCALNNHPLPMSVLQVALRRNKAEQQVTHGRACLIKAYLNRWIRRYEPTTKELTMSLDKDRLEIGYLLGRLFALLERAQEGASQNLNATIRERYFSAASTTPMSVFPTLIRLMMHHLGKMRASGKDKGKAVYLEKVWLEISDKISDYPSHLDMKQQGFFSLGYTQQRQSFFTKQESQQTESTIEE